MKCFMTTSRVTTSQIIRLVVVVSAVTAFSSQSNATLGAGPPTQKPGINAIFEQGMSWYEKGEWGKAIESFNEVILRDPKHLKAHYFRGISLYRKGEVDKSLKDFDSVIALDPNDSRAFNNRGAVWAEKGKLKYAFADYEVALRLDPKYARAFSNRGSAYRRIGEYEKALKDLDEAIRLDPKLEIAYYNRAFLLAACPESKHRDGKKAIEDAKKACELSNWKSGANLEALATAYAEAGDYSKAVIWEKKAHEDRAYMRAYREGAEKRLKLFQRKKPYRDAEPTERVDG
jgi:tetratricopeptide (TPR) repeat protein